MCASRVRKRTRHITLRQRRNTSLWRSHNITAATPQRHFFFPTEPNPWTDSNRQIVGDDLPGVPINSAQTGRRGRRPLQFKNYLQSHRCNGILDRFELPHYSACRNQGESEKDAFSVRIDSNYRIASKAMQNGNTK